MRSSSCVFLGLSAFMLGSCSDESRVRSLVEDSQPNAEFFDFQSVTRDEYAAELDAFLKPATPPRGQQRSAYEVLQDPQLANAKYYSIKSRMTNGYGNEVVSIRYCRLVEDKIDCAIRKSLTSIEDARRKNSNG